MEYVERRIKQYAVAIVIAVLMVILIAYNRFSGNKTVKDVAYNSTDDKGIIGDSSIESIGNEMPGIIDKWSDKIQDGTKDIQSNSIGVLSEKEARKILKELSIRYREDGLIVYKETEEDGKADIVDTVSKVDCKHKRRYFKRQLDSKNVARLYIDYNKHQEIRKIGRARVKMHKKLWGDIHYTIVNREKVEIDKHLFLNGLAGGLNKGSIEISNNKNTFRGNNDYYVIEYKSNNEFDRSVQYIYVSKDTHKPIGLCIKYINDEGIINSNKTVYYTVDIDDKVTKKNKIALPKLG